MFTVAIVVHITVSVILVVTVLLSSGKGASLGSSFGGSTSSQALFGSAGPAGMLTKITAACAVIFMVTSLYITYVSAHKDSSSIMQDVPAIKEAPAVPVEVPTAESEALKALEEAKAKAEEEAGLTSEPAKEAPKK